MRQGHEKLLNGQGADVPGIHGAVEVVKKDMAIMRSMRDRANRIRNCDTANIKRTLKVAEEQTALALEIHIAGVFPFSTFWSARRTAESVTSRCS